MFSLGKIISFFLLCVSLGFIALGVFFQDGVSHQTSVVIDGNIEDVWTSFTDVEKMPLWMFGLEKAEMVQGNYGEEGSVVDFVYKGDNPSEATVIRETFSQIREKEQLSFQATIGHFETFGEITFSESNGETTIKQVVRNRGKNFFWRAYAPLMESVFKTSSESLYGNFKRHFEKVEKARE